MPHQLIVSVQQMAKDQNTTVSDIVRALVEAELTRQGYPTTEPPIEGQVKIE